MQDKNELYAIMMRNERIGKKFFEIETEILTILDFRSLFERLVTLIQDKFDVPHVWITLLEGTPLAKLINDVYGEDSYPEHLVMVKPQDCLCKREECLDPILANSQLDSYDFMFPAEAKNRVQSVAIAPLSLDGELVGCINQADVNPDRFQPDMDTTLLAQLAIKVSLCLSNVTAHERLARLAHHDPLTGLLNRRAMENRLREEFHRAHRYNQSMTVVFIDMDEFKQINDSLGHDAGDAVLEFFAQQLEKMARRIDHCARFAGDEFVAILPCTELAQAEAFMERVSKFFRFTPVPGIDRLVRFSYGLASTADAKLTSPEALLKRADEELFERKAANKEAFKEAALA